MRYPIILLIAFLSGLSLFTSCQKEENGPADAIYVRLYNDTGINLYDLNVNADSTKIIDYIKDNKKSDYLKFEEFWTMNGRPNLYMHVKDGDDNDLFIAWQWCGTGAEIAQLDKGYYTVRLYREKGSDTIYQEFE